MNDPRQAVRGVATEYLEAWTAHDTVVFDDFVADDTGFVILEGLWFKCGVAGRGV